VSACSSSAEPAARSPSVGRTIPAESPLLAEAFRKNAVDPLSALERIRAALRAPERDGSFKIPVYDGARRFDIVGRVLPKTNPADGIIRAELTLRPIAGFKGETSEDGDPDDAPRKVELTVTDDTQDGASVDQGSHLLYAAGGAVSAGLRSA